MGNRVVNGSTNSENGWPLVDQGSCQWVDIPGTDVSLEIQQGPPAQILAAFAADFNAEIEPLRDADSACWTEGNSVLGGYGQNNGSNHMSGSACDFNWASHPFQVANAGFNAAQIAKLRELLAWYEDTVFWGNDWDTPKDAMHFQMGYDTYGNPHTADFITRKISADGYSTRRGAEPTVDAAAILSQAMGGRLSLDRYRELLPAYSAQLLACDCTTVPRIAMNAAQLGHESGGLYYTEEIASGAAYEGRADLGNTQPGDGVRFKGRSWIQITGRSNYTRLSQWAFGKGLVPSATFFVDNPAELASDEYAGLGAAWYWVVARPDINALSDARDIETVSKRINGTNANTGRANGIDDRIARYNNALAMGDQLLSLTAGRDGFLMALSDTEQRELLDLARQQAGVRRPSKSPLRWPGEGDVDTCAGFAWAGDANVHVLLVEKLAVEYQDPQSITLLSAVASTKLPDRQDDAKLAAAILAKVPKKVIDFSGATVATTKAAS